MTRFWDSNYLRAILFIGVFALSGVAYRQVRTFDFLVYDDNVYVTENRQVQQGLSREGLIWAITTNYGANWHPLTWLSHMLDVEWFGLRPGPHHLTNVVIHLASAALLMLALRQMTGNFYCSLFVAALFALHPAHAESVAWVSERKDVLSALFFMLTLLSYAFYVRAPSAFRYVLVLISTTLGLTAKPMLVTLPLVLLLLDFWPLKRWQQAEAAPAGKPTRRAPARKPSRRGTWQRRLLLITEKGPLFLLVIGSSVITFIAQRQGGAVAPLRMFPISIRLENAVVSYVRYVIKMFWPVNLAPFYPHPGNSLPLWQFVGSLLILLLVSAAVLFKARAFPYLAVGWFWFLGTLVPVIGIVQVGEQAMADRYSYIPFIGLFIALTWSIAESIPDGVLYEAVVASLAIVAVALLAWLCWIQAGYWKNSITLFEHALDVTRNNHLAENNLGYALTKIGRWDEAVVHYRKSLQISPDYVHAHNNLGAALAYQGKTDEAMFHYREALRLRPDQPEAQINVGIEMAQQGSSREALHRLSEAIRFKPDDPRAHYNMGLVLAQQGRWEEAVNSYQNALRYRPEYPEVHMNLGVALAQLGKTSQALIHYRQALGQKPDYTDAHVNLGIELATQNRLNEAVSHFSEAVRLNPDSAEGHFNLGKAWLLLNRKHDAIKELEILRKLHSPLAGQLENMLARN
ncbi:MAG TPA: tetratricopeptide repeat protein [Acidobacteriota bacterium]|jgi:Flp pilus assembly protein TadD